jgi:hypothetical protein
VCGLVPRVGWAALKKGIEVHSVFSEKCSCLSNE